MNKDAASTVQKQRGRPFPKGVSGNPKGRPVGAKQKLSEAFLGDLVSAWATEGKGAIQRCVATDPAAFLRIVASVLPKELDVTHRAAESLTEEQARHMAEELLARSQQRASRDQRGAAATDPVHAGIPAGLPGR